MSETNYTPSFTSGPSAKSSSKYSTASQSGFRKRDLRQQTVTISLIWYAIRRWWKVASPVGLLLATIPATYIYVTYEPMFQALSWLRMEASPPYVAYRLDGNSRSFVQTQVQLIRSPLVLGPVVSEPEIANLPELKKQRAPIDWLARHVGVNSRGESELFTVSFTGPNAQNTARIVNAVVSAYFELRFQEQALRTQRVVELLDHEKERRANELRLLRENVRQLTKDATGKDPFMGPEPIDTAISHPFSTLQRRLAAGEMEQEILKARITAAEESLAKLGGQEDQQGEEGQSMREKVVPEEVVQQAVEQRPEVQQAEAILAANRSKLEQIAARSAKGEQDPFYQQLLKSIAQDEEALKEIRMELREKLAKDIREQMVRYHQAALAEMRASLENLRRLEGVLTGIFERQLADMKEYSGETLELEFKRSELARAQDVLGRITTRLSELRTEQGAPQRVSLLKPAEIPTIAVTQFPYRKIVFLSFACFCLPFGLAVLWERILRRVSNPQDFEQQANLPVVGEIARLPARSGVGSSRRVGRNLRVFEESIDSLRTALLLSETLKDMRVLVVTSAVNHEGKTSVAAQLAVSIARASGELTLLIDGDMRSPDVHNVFDIPLEPGLAEVLDHQHSLEDAIATSWSKYVHLVPAGKLHSSPHKLLGNGSMKSLLDKVPDRYRYIVVDTPPVLAASESLVLAKAADASLICAMQDVSRVDQVAKTYERLVAAGGNPIGTVLNGIPAKRYAYRYGSYSYSYSHG